MSRLAIMQLRAQQQRREIMEMSEKEFMRPLPLDTRERCDNCNSPDCDGCNQHSDDFGGNSL